MPLNPALFDKVFFRPVQLLVLGFTLALVLRVQIRPRIAWTVSALGLLAFVVSVILGWPRGTDVHHFHVAGTDVLAGIDPYHNEFVVWPPTGFPIFAVLASLPFETTLAVWTLINMVGYAVVVLVARWALRNVGDSESWQLPDHGVGLLTAALLLSVSCRYGLDMGQLSLFTTLAILLALAARARGRSILAGICLALGTVKAATLVPFLLILRRRRDWVTWVAFPAACVGLYVLASPPAELFTRLRECLHNISVLSTPGHMNNFAHVVNFDMVAFDRTVYFLGVDDRGLVRITQIALIGLLGAWVAWRLLGPNPLSEPAACAVLAFYASVFFYHRLYDMPILVLPLLYAVGRAQVTQGAVRWLCTGSALCVLGVLYARLEIAKQLSYTPRAAPLLEALLVPHATWLTLAGLAFLAAAEWVRPHPVEVVVPIRRAA